MREFTDKNGHKWAISVDGSHVLRCKKELGVNLPGIFAEESKGFLELVQDFEKLYAVLWILCEKQANQLKVDPDTFASGIGGDELGAAVIALEQAVIDFFPVARQRTVLRLAGEKHRETTDQILSLVEKVLTQATPPNGDTSSSYGRSA